MIATPLVALLCRLNASLSTLDPCILVLLRVVLLPALLQSVETTALRRSRQPDLTHPTRLLRLPHRFRLERPATFEISRTTGTPLARRVRFESLVRIGTFVRHATSVSPAKLEMIVTGVTSVTTARSVKSATCAMVASPPSRPPNLSLSKSLSPLLSPWQPKPTLPR